MRYRPSVACLSVASLLLMAAAAPAQDAKTAADHWEEFVHHINIARPDIALGHGQYLLDQVSEGELLDAVEASRHADTFHESMTRGQGMETIREVVIKVAKKIEDARIQRAREPERIRQNIQRLGQGERARRNAMVRLRAAGQFAAPHLLKTLQDPNEQKLHGEVLRAMREIGRDVVYPLSVALNQLDPVQMDQIATVLGQIGYPRALPYLKRVMEDESINQRVRETVARSYERIAGSQAVTLSAAALFLAQAQRYYTQATDATLVLPGTDSYDDTGVIWEYSRVAGLVPTHVPARIFGDVLAHRDAREALKLNPDLDQALSTWLMANLRRENRLGEGEDPSYPAAWQPPIFYAYAANPLRSQDVLQRALNDNDAALARDAIEALRHNAGTQVMVNQAGRIQPMLRALSYPDRRVRFEAAFAMVNNRAEAPYTGSYRVVPVLAEAVRQTESKYALVIARTQEGPAGFNEIASVLRANGYEAFGGTSLATATDQLRLRPGVDLIVTSLDLPGVQQIYNQSAEDYKLTGVPIVAVGQGGSLVTVNAAFRGNERVRTAEWTDDAEAMKAAIEQARQSYAGAAMTPEEAANYASTALTHLREVAIAASDVYPVADAETSVIAALKDPRQPIVQQAGGVLAILNSDRSQRALADAALDANLPEATRVSLLTSLAESARQHGARVTNTQLENLHNLVESATGDVALAAARAYGALAQPTEKIVDMIAQ